MSVVVWKALSEMGLIVNKVNVKMKTTAQKMKTGTSQISIFTSYRRLKVYKVDFWTTKYPVFEFVPNQQALIVSVEKVTRDVSAYAPMSTNVSIVMCVIMVQNVGIQKEVTDASVETAILAMQLIVMPAYAMLLLSALKMSDVLVQLVSIVNARHRYISFFLSFSNANCMHLT